MQPALSLTKFAPFNPGIPAADAHTVVSSDSSINVSSEQNRFSLIKPLQYLVHIVHIRFIYNFTDPSELSMTS